MTYRRAYGEFRKTTLHLVKRNQLVKGLEILS